MLICRTNILSFYFYTKSRLVKYTLRRIMSMETTQTLANYQKHGTAPVDTRHDEEYAGTFGSAFPQATKPKDHCSFVLLHHLVKVASLLIMI